MTWTGPLFWAAAALYGAAFLLYATFLFGHEGARRPARWLLAAGFLMHFMEIGARGVAGMHPASSAHEAIGLVSWLFVGGFLLAGLRRRIDAVGAIVAPAALILLVTARLSPEQGGAPAAGLGTLGRVHISLATAGVSIFALATALALLYLVEERQLKRKRIGALVKQGAALETLDRLTHRLVQIGFPIFTVAMVTGAWWSARLAEGIRPESGIALVAWTAFAGLLVARTTAGWRGRRAAMVTVTGFGLTLAVLLIYLARRVVGG